MKEMAEVPLNCFLFISVFGIIAGVKSSGLQVIKDAVGDQNGLEVVRQPARYLGCWWDLKVIVPRLTSCLSSLGCIVKSQLAAGSFALVQWPFLFDT